VAQVTWTLEAQTWLRDIHDFIAADNPLAAEKVVLGLHASGRSLQLHPRLGRRYVHIIDREVRVLVRGHYRIAYLIKAGSEDIEILGIFHGALPIERYLL
jgi:plasmid stabilization system protein ParE